VCGPAAARCGAEAPVRPATARKTDNVADRLVKALRGAIWGADRPGERACGATVAPVLDRAAVAPAVCQVERDGRGGRVVLRQDAVRPHVAGHDLRGRVAVRVKDHGHAAADARVTDPAADAASGEAHRLHDEGDAVRA